MGQKPPSIHKFTLIDEWGEKHNYETTAFRPSQAGQLRYLVASLIVQPLAVAFWEAVQLGDFSELKDLFSAFGPLVDANGQPIPDGDPRWQQVKQIRALAAEQLQSKMGQVDPNKIAATVRDALRDMPGDLAQRLLEHTYRDGDMLSAEDQFDLAYERNYFEQDAALWEVLRFNNFLSLSAILRLKPAKKP